MVGAYAAIPVARLVGFWPGLVLAPLVAGALERAVTLLPAPGAQVRPRARTAHHLGLSYVILELVQLIYGRTAVDSCRPRRCAARRSHRQFVGDRLQWLSARRPKGDVPGRRRQRARVCSPSRPARLICSWPSLMLWAVLMLTRRASA